MLLQYIKKYKLDLTVQLFLLIISSLFFLRLFYPVPSFFITPEYGKSDITHFNMPVKNFLSESLKKWQLPLWNKNMDTGYPIYAESQMGTWYAPNIILFSLLPFPLAFNLGYIVTFYIASSGMYFSARYYKASRYAAIFATIAFAYSGFFIGHINHYNVIQATSLLPWILVFGLKLLSSKTHTRLFFVATTLLVSQQLLSGFLQITFISGLILLTLAILTAPQRKAQIKRVALVFLVFTIAFALSAVQILPSVELITRSSRSSGFSSTSATYFSYSLEHLKTFLNPFLLGKVSNGTYPPFTKFDGNIFWENNSYMGVATLLLIIGAMVQFVLKKKQWQLWFIAFCGVLLATGKNSPIYFLFSFFPFSYFTTPSRFMIVAIFAFSILAAITLDTFITKYIPKQKRKLMFTGAVAVLLIDIFYHWYTYHPVVLQTQWLAPPQTVEYLTHHNFTGRIFSPDEGDQWVDTFIDGGWENKLNSYIYLRNELTPNINLLWNIPHNNSYVGRAWTRRSVLLNLLLNGDISQTKTAIKIGTVSTRILAMNSVEYIITAKTISDKNFQLVYQISNEVVPQGSKLFKIYKNLNALPRARFVQHLYRASTQQDILRTLKSPTFEASTSAIIESSLKAPKKPTQQSKSFASIYEDENMFVRLHTISKTDQILILADSYFPGWNAYIDGVKTPIYPANINSRAIQVPAGLHEVVFAYIPQSFTVGAIISALSLVVISFLVVFPVVFSAFRKQRSTTKRSSGH